MRNVARFAATDIERISDILSKVYEVSSMTQGCHGDDNETFLLFGDFIAALDECDSIEIVEDAEMLVDEG